MIHTIVQGMEAERAELLRLRETVATQAAEILRLKNLLSRSKHALGYLDPKMAQHVTRTMLAEIAEL